MTTQETEELMKLIDDAFNGLRASAQKRDAIRALLGQAYDRGREYERTQIALERETVE